MKKESPKSDRFDACLDIALEAGLDRVWVEDRGRQFEFGGDPDYVAWQIRIAEYLIARGKQLVDSVSLERDGLAIANHFYSLARELDDLKEWLVEVRESDFGKRENARELKCRLERVIGSNLIVWSILNGNQGGKKK